MYGHLLVFVLLVYNFEGVVFKCLKRLLVLLLGGTFLSQIVHLAVFLSTGEKWHHAMHRFHFFPAITSLMLYSGGGCTVAYSATVCVQLSCHIR